MVKSNLSVRTWGKDANRRLAERAIPKGCKPQIDTWSQTKFGGAYRDRTDDPLLAKQVLSQLS